MAIQQTFDYLNFIEEFRRLYGINSEEELAQLLTDPHKINEKLDEVEKIRETQPEGSKTPLFYGDLDYDRLRWSLEFINNYPNRGGISKSQFGHLADTLQTTEDYVVKLVIPVLAQLGLVSIDEKGVYLTDKALRRKIL